MTRDSSGARGGSSMRTSWWAGPTQASALHKNVLLQEPTGLHAMDHSLLQSLMRVQNRFPHTPAADPAARSCRRSKRRYFLPAHAGSTADPSFAGNRLDPQQAPKLVGV